MKPEERAQRCRASDCRKPMLHEGTPVIDAACPQCIAAEIHAAETDAAEAMRERAARVSERTADESKWRWTGHMNGRKLSGPHALGLDIAAAIRALNDVPQTKGD